MAKLRFVPTALELGLLILTAAGCTNSSVGMPGPATIDLTGTWAGSVVVLDTTAKMTWTLTEASSAVTGPALLVLPTGTVLLNGVVTGTMSGATLTYVIAVGPGGIPTQPACTGQLGGTMTATIGATSTLAGSVAVTASTCTPPYPGGNLTLSK
jgi:hypothetical protein